MALSSEGAFSYTMLCRTIAALVGETTFDGLNPMEGEPFFVIITAFNFSGAIIETIDRAVRLGMLSINTYQIVVPKIARRTETNS